MELAHVIAKRASCLRKQVGAVLVRERDKQIISTGYNGAPRGMPDCHEAGCELREIGGKLSCVRTLHAESNAIDRIVVPLVEPHTLYCTVIPCRDCALRIIQNGMIQRVVYTEYYESRNTKDVEALFARQDPSTVAMGPQIGMFEPRVKLEQLKL
jgi:dCMP deaminase